MKKGNINEIKFYFSIKNNDIANGILVFETDCVIRKELESKTFINVFNLVVEETDKIRKKLNIKGYTGQFTPEVEEQLSDRELEYLRMGVLFAQMQQGNLEAVKMKKIDAN